MKTKGIGVSEKGERSVDNEDTFLILANQDFYLVADGVGGGPGGREASKIVARELIAASGEELNKDKIISCIEGANRSIRKFADDNAQRGMASTVAAVWFDSDKAVVFNVGDSRVYRLASDGNLKQLSTDHSKTIEKENRSKNVVTNALGARDQVEVEVFECSYNTLDVFALMSDGISDVVADDKIGEVASSKQLGLLDKCSALIQEACVNGGKDDKTIVFVAASV